MLSLTNLATSELLDQVLVYNEYNNANANPIEGRLFARLLRPGPYHFQDKAALAFRQFSKTVRLPSPMLAISKKTKMVK
jgi:hypothetical protein